MDLSFTHAGDYGDLCYALPTIRALGGGVLYLNIIANGTRESMSPSKRDFIAPLLEAQPYIKSVEMYSGCAVCYDLNYWREYWRNNSEAGVSLAEWVCRAFGVNVDVINQKWIECGKKKIEPVVIHRSERYHNPEFKWRRVVEKYKGQSVFVGLKQEHDKFIKEFGFVPFYKVKDALDMAMVINGAKLTIVNQSFPGAVAEGLKKPKILECCPRHVDCCFERSDVQNIFTRNFYLPRIKWKSAPLKPELNPDTVEIPLRHNRIIHCVERHKQKDADAERRVEFAVDSWENLYRSGEVIPCHVSDFKRTSLGVGDKRGLPYLKDVLSAGMAMSKHDDDIIMLTNDDTVLHPDIATALFTVKALAVCSGRSDFKMGEMPNTTSTAIRPDDEWGEDIGRDLFAFKRSFLVDRFDEIPDFFLGESEWDLVVSAWIRKSLFGSLTTADSRKKRDPHCELPVGYVWHEDHSKVWKQVDSKAPAKLHNARLMARFYESNGMGYLDWTRRSTYRL